VYVLGIPQGAALNPLGWWGLYVLLAMEFCALGAFLGEFNNIQMIVRKRKKEIERKDMQHESDRHGT